MTAARSIAAARVAKIQRLAVAARQLGFSTRDVATSFDNRTILVAKAGVREPSSDTWRDLVLYMLVDEGTQQ